MENWPAEFQVLLNEESFGIKLGDTTVRSDMDVGLSKVRSRYTRGIDVFNSTITIDIDLYPVLDEFYKVTLGNGVRTFAFNHPMTQVASEWRFAEPPDVQPLGGRTFTVSMKWELIP